MNERECFANRINLIQNNLRLSNNGADIHEVGNMRNLATLLMVYIEAEHEDLPHDFNDRICALERRVVYYFKKKYKDLL